MMKKLNLIPGLLIVLFSLATTSCEKEEPLSEAILGKWEVQEETIIVYVNNVKKESQSYFLDADEEVYQFAEGGTGIYYEDGQVNGMFTWTLEGNTLTFQGTSDIACIMTIENDVLIWSYETVDTQDASVTYEYIFTAKRIA